MDAPPSALWTGTITPSFLSATNCPDPGDYCWVLNSAGATSRETSTAAYSFVQITYSVVASGLGGGDNCLIAYSTDGSSFSDIEKISRDTAVTGVTKTYNGWGSTVDAQPSLIIQISFKGSGQFCYFNEFKLEGILTANPTVSITVPPTTVPSNIPTDPPSTQPPSKTPSGHPTSAPSRSPSQFPTQSIPLTIDPTSTPTRTLTMNPTSISTQAIPQTIDPTSIPTRIPTRTPTMNPTSTPSIPTLPTLPTTIAPTSATMNPSMVPSSIPSHVPTTSSPSPSPTDAPTLLTMTPTAPTTNPTDTVHVVDASDLFLMFIISNVLKSDHTSSSLLLVTLSDHYIRLDVDLLLESPIEASSVISIKETDYSHSVDAHYTQFWQITYTVWCQSINSGGDGLIWNGGWKVQFTTNCTRLECAQYLENNGITQHKVSIENKNEFEFEDTLCIDSLYVHSFVPNIKHYKDGTYSLERSDGNQKYKEGDTVYIEIHIEDDEYEMNDVSISNVFGCIEDSISTVGVYGIGGCLLSDSWSTYILESDIDGARVSFQIPNGAKAESDIFNIQIQATLSVSMVSETSAISIQIRHFVADIALNGASKQSVSLGISGGGIAMIIISSIFCVLLLVQIGRKMREKYNDKREEETWEAEMVRSTTGTIRNDDLAPIDTGERVSDDELDDEDDIEIVTLDTPLNDQELKEMEEKESEEKEGAATTSYTNIVANTRKRKKKGTSKTKGKKPPNSPKNIEKKKKKRNNDEEKYEPRSVRFQDQKKRKNPKNAKSSNSAKKPNTRPKSAKGSKSPKSPKLYVTKSPNSAKRPKSAKAAKSMKSPKSSKRPKTPKSSKSPKTQKLKTSPKTPKASKSSKRKVKRRRPRSRSVDMDDTKEPEGEEFGIVTGSTTSTTLKSPNVYNEDDEEKKENRGRNKKKGKRTKRRSKSMVDKNTMIESKNKNMNKENTKSRGRKKEKDDKNVRAKKRRAKSLIMDVDQRAKSKDKKSKKKSPQTPTPRTKSSSKKNNKKGRPQSSRNRSNKEENK